ncbi:MAG: hypothetical protein IT385_17350 [Deltaproteobacteria bacterium]|nr:hypothetical protein [Deltaproteobacteria bacterium]
MPIRSFAALSLLLAASSSPACSKDSAASDPTATSEAAPEPACPPLSVRLDGEPFTSFGSRYAFTKQGKRFSAIIVRWAEKPGVTCAEVVEPDFDVSASETYVTAGMGMIGFGSTLETVELRPLTADPTKPGDVAGVCIPETTFVAGSGPHKGKKVTIGGALEAPWCGVQPSSRP